MSSQPKNMSFVDLLAFPFDAEFVLSSPSRVVYVFHVEGCPPEQALMVNVPLSMFAENLEPLRAFVALKLKRTLVALVLDDETPRSAQHDSGTRPSDAGAATRPPREETGDDATV